MRITFFSLAFLCPIVYNNFPTLFFRVTFLESYLSHTFVGKKNQRLHLVQRIWGRRIHRWKKFYISALYTNAKQIEKGYHNHFVLFQMTGQSTWETFFPATVVLRRIIDVIHDYQINLQQWFRWLYIYFFGKKKKNKNVQIQLVGGVSSYSFWLMKW